MYLRLRWLHMRQEVNQSSGYWPLTSQPGRGVCAPHLALFNRRGTPQINLTKGHASREVVAFDTRLRRAMTL